MDAFICTACGTQYTSSSAVSPPRCAICDDERQYVPPRGQTWTTPEALAAGHFNSYRQYEPGVIGIGTQPSFAIGQRALFVCTPNGNVLWDCIAMLDPATITLINSLRFIASSYLVDACTGRSDGFCAVEDTVDITRRDDQQKLLYASRPKVTCAL